MEDVVEVREESGRGGGFEGVADFGGVVGEGGGGGGDVDDATLGAEEWEEGLAHLRLQQVCQLCIHHQMYGSKKERRF